MNILKISKKTSLNEVENFLDDVCDAQNFPDSFYGNIIIAITEMVTSVTSLAGGGRLTFVNEKGRATFNFQIDSNFEEVKNIFSNNWEKNDLESDLEKSNFLIMALCDDFILDEDSLTISLVFMKENIQSEISLHRKEYLENYLGKKSEVLKDTKIGN